MTSTLVAALETSDLVAPGIHGHPGLEQQPDRR